MPMTTMTIIKTVVVIKRDGRAILSRLEYGVWYIRKVYLAFGVT